MTPQKKHSGRGVRAQASNRFAVSYLAQPDGSSSYTIRSGAHRPAAAAPTVIGGPGSDLTVSSGSRWGCSAGGSDGLVEQRDVDLCAMSRQIAGSRIAPRTDRLGIARALENPPCPHRNRKLADSLLEGGGFEPSVPRHNELCVAPVRNVPGRDDPLHRQLGSGCKAEPDQPTTLRRVRLARISVGRAGRRGVP